MREGESFVGTRVITRDHECLRALGGLIFWDFQDGSRICRFIGIFRMGEDLLTQVGVRALDERLRAFTRDHERLRVFTCVGWIVWSRICRIYWDFQDGGGPADAGALVRALDESLRAFTRDHERLRLVRLREIGMVVPMGRPRNGKNKLHPDGCGLLCAEHEVFLGWCSMVGPLMRPGEAGFPLSALLSW